MSYNKLSYKVLKEREKSLQEKIEVLESRLNELLEEQILFKDNTFSYVDEARKIYSELIKLRKELNYYQIEKNKIDKRRAKKNKHKR